MNIESECACGVECVCLELAWDIASSTWLPAQPPTPHWECGYSSSLAESSDLARSCPLGDRREKKMQQIADAWLVQEGESWIVRWWEADNLLIEVFPDEFGATVFMQALVGGY